MKKSTKRLIEIGIVLSGIGLLYLIGKKSILSITKVDKQNKVITYTWRGEEYEWYWEDHGPEKLETIELDGDHFIIAEKKIISPPSVKLYYYQTRHYKQGYTHRLFATSETATFV